MREHVMAWTIVSALALAGCGGGDPAEQGTAPAVDGGASGGPAGEVAPDSRPASEDGTAKAPKVTEPAPAAGPVTPPGVDEAWGVYYATGIPFEFGAEAGLAEARRAGKPAMLFYGATW